MKIYSVKSKSFSFPFQDFGFPLTRRVVLAVISCTLSALLHAHRSFDLLYIYLLGVDLGTSQRQEGQENGLE